MNTHVILTQVDESCSMAKVSLNGKTVMEGNFWDFHPGCHGIEEYGYFRGHNSLKNAIVRKLSADPNVKIVVKREEYKWDDDDDTVNFESEDIPIAGKAMTHAKEFTIKEGATRSSIDAIINRLEKKHPNGYSKCVNGNKLQMLFTSIDALNDLEKALIKRSLINAQ